MCLQALRRVAGRRQAARRVPARLFCHTRVSMVPRKCPECAVVAVRRAAPALLSQPAGVALERHGMKGRWNGTASRASATPEEREMWRAEGNGQRCAAAEGGARQNDAGRESCSAEG